MNEQNPEVEDALPDNIEVATPGQLLQEAREAAQLSVDDISRKLHLKSALITAIEKDNFDEGSSITFARGYLKAYAKLVHVDEGEVLTAFECFNDAEQQTQMQTFSNRKGKKKFDSWLMSLTLLVVIGIVAAVAVWFMRNQQTEPAPVSASTSTSQVSQLPTSPSNTASSNTEQSTAVAQSQNRDNLSPAGELLEPEEGRVLEPEEGRELEPEEGRELEPEEGEQPEPQSEVNLAEQQRQSPSVDESDIADTQTQIVEQDSNESESNETESAVTQSTAQSSAELANVQANIQEPNGGDSGDNSGESTFAAENAEQESQQAMQETVQETLQEIVTAHLELRFEDSCWINIEDATGERIAIGTKVKGHYTSVHGVPPFTIKLGKPDVVSIWLDGQAREIPYYPKGSIANFELAAN